MKSATLYTDGGSRGNPGPAGIGVVLTLSDGQKHTHSAYIGDKTNNQAEYMALIEGIRLAKLHKVESLNCFLDSELVVQQLNGKYKVKNAGIKELFTIVQKELNAFDSVRFAHVKRANNAEADALVNQALDAQKPHRS